MKQLEVHRPDGQVKEYPWSTKVVLFVQEAKNKCEMLLGKDITYTITESTKEKTIICLTEKEDEGIKI